MPRAWLTRRVRFTAEHRYHHPGWSPERNRTTFGTHTSPGFHAHDYVCEVTVAGEIDPDTGMIVDLGVLDGVLDAEVRDRLHGRNLNRDVPEFAAEGGLVPTGENVARVIFERVGSALAGIIEVDHVVVRESDTLAAEYRGAR